jgi:hypothetical protein
MENLIIVHNNKEGIILKEGINEDRYNTLLRATKLFNSIYSSKCKFSITEVYKPSSNSLSKTIFNKIQFHFSGTDEAGKQTIYNTNIDTQLNDKQIEFIGLSNINCITFFK